jgi:hypothetical protein
VGAPMTAAQTRAQMKKWRVPFKEFSGWTTRKRPGTFAPVGLIIHHTGSDSGQNSPSYDNFLFVRGRPEDGIPGPLCQAACEMDGDVILGAIGRANHAGSGSATTLTIVRKDAASRTAEVRPGADGTNGNGWFYGLEVKFDGGQPMTTKQYDGAVRWAAAICDFYGWTAGSVIGHKEWSRRKPDPGNTFMAKFRRDVDARLKAGPGGPAPTPPPVVKPPVSLPPADTTVQTKAIVRAAGGGKFGTTPAEVALLKDATQYLAWGRALGVVSAWTFAEWVKQHNNAPKNRELYVACVKAIQKKFGQVADGKIDIDAILPMQRYGYTLIGYDGKPIPKAGTPTPRPPAAPKPVPNTMIWTKAIVHAAQGGKWNDTDEGLKDVRQYLAWARAIGVVSPWTEAEWYKQRNNSPRNRELFVACIKAVQKKFGQKADGQIDLDAILPMQKYGYTLLDYSGKVIPKQ